MSGKTEWIRSIETNENSQAVALEAQRAAVELRLALRGAARRGGYFDPDNVQPALDAMRTIEKALDDYCARLRTERGQLREER